MQLNKNLKKNKENDNIYKSEAQKVQKSMMSKHPSFFHCKT